MKRELEWLEALGHYTSLIYEESLLGMNAFLGITEGFIYLNETFLNSKVYILKRSVFGESNFV